MTPSNTPEASRRVGEVVRASTIDFVTQCYRLYDAPPLGSLVRSGGDRPVYGVVAQVATQSIDSGRSPVARGEDEESEEAIYLSNPQLGRLLFTEFSSVVVGHQVDGRLRRYVAPLPPNIHSFVFVSGQEELRSFSSSMDLIPTLLDPPIGPRDDVVASFLRLASAVHQDPEEYLVAAGKELAVLLSGQMQRLNGLLRRLSP